MLEKGCSQHQLDRPNIVSADSLETKNVGNQTQWQSMATFAVEMISKQII